MIAGVFAKRNFTASDTGAGAATAEPPSASANESDREGDRGPGGTDDAVGSDSAELDILKQYRGMLEAIRKLPKLMQPAARRDAGDWLRTSLKALRERRSAERRARNLERLKKAQRPRFATRHSRRGFDR